MDSRARVAEGRALSTCGSRGGNRGIKIPALCLRRTQTQGRGSLGSRDERKGGPAPDGGCLSMARCKFLSDSVEQSLAFLKQLLVVLPEFYLPFRNCVRRPSQAVGYGINLLFDVWSAHDQRLSPRRIEVYGRGLPGKQSGILGLQRGGFFRGVRPI